MGRKGEGSPGVSQESVPGRGRMEGWAGRRITADAVRDAKPPVLWVAGVGGRSQRPPFPIWGTEGGPLLLSVVEHVYGSDSSFLVGAEVVFTPHIFFLSFLSRILTLSFLNNV